MLLVLKFLCSYSSDYTLFGKPATGWDRIRWIPSRHTMCRYPLVASYGCCFFLSEHLCWVPTMWEALCRHQRYKNIITESLPRGAHSPVVRGSVNLPLWSQCLLARCTARPWREMLGFPSSRFWVPAIPGERRAHSQPLSKHLVSIHFVQETGAGEGWLKQIRYTSLPWEIYKSNPSSFQVANTLLPLGSASGYYTCSFHATEVSPGHGLLRPSGQTCVIFLGVTLYEKANWPNEPSIAQDLNNNWCQNCSHSFQTNQRKSEGPLNLHQR